jgi:hypothetical protein
MLDRRQEKNGGVETNSDETSKESNDDLENVRWETHDDATLGLMLQEFPF